jgi:hypothetical protein
MTEERAENINNHGQWSEQNSSSSDSQYDGYEGGISGVEILGDN